MSETLLLLQELIRCPSVTPEDAGCQNILIERLQKVGFTIQQISEKGVSNFFAKKGENSPSFCFAGHTDVVPPGDESAWQSPPFSPSLRDGYLFGRGAADMKSGIAAMVTACERFIKNHPKHLGSIAFLITSDEEGPALFGTQAVLKILKAQNQIPEWCLVGEASSVHSLGDTLKVGRRGSFTADLKIFGKQGHVAYPALANNAIHIALLALDEIANVKWNDAKDPFPATTLQFTNIHAGTGTNNVIPGTLQAQFNLRFAPTTTPEYIENTVKNILEAHKLKYEITWRLSAKPFYTDTQSILIQKVANTIEKELGINPELSTSGGTSDGRFFAEYGVKVVELGPINATIHQVNECIAVEELDKLSHVYEKILESLLL